MAVIWIDSGRFAPAIALDPNAAAYIAAVEAADTQALEPAVRAAINDFVVGCKADGIWAAIKASCILAGARTLNGALVPLVGTAPTNVNYTDYTRKGGLQKVGSFPAFQYLDANVPNNSLILPQNNRHLCVRATERSTSFTRFIGSDEASTSGGSNVDVGNNVAARLAGATSSTFFGAAGSFWGSSRSSSTSIQIINNGIVNTYAQNSVVPTSASICVGGSPLSGFAGSNGSRFSFYSIGESLDLALLDARVTDLINAFDAAI
jgi:hypothetical protein